LVLALALTAGAASPVAAQSVTSSDVQRLQDGIYDASRAIGQLRARDAAAASQLQAELDEVSDEAIYLKVKLRKNEPIARRDYTDLRDHIDSIGNRARTGDRAGWQPGGGAGTAIDDRPVSTAGYPDRAPSPTDNRSPADAAPRPQNPNEIPVATEFDVRLQNPLSSKTSQVEDRFEATTMVDLRDERGRVMVPAGSLMRGVVSSVNRATRTDRKGAMTVAFDRVTVNGVSYPIRATVSQALESEGIMGEKEKIGIGAGVGGILGAILGGGKGAAIGAAAGAGAGAAAVAAGDRNAATLPSGTAMTVRILQPITVTSDNKDE
jgi:hypothetical protein